MRAILDVLLLALELYWFIVVAAVIFSWLFAFNVVNSGNQFVGMVGQFLHQATEPALRPIRRFMPNLGSIDISPIILLLIVFFLQQVIRRYGYAFVPF